MNENLELDLTISEEPRLTLEIMLIKDYLREKGFQLSELASLPAEKAKRLIAEACLHADLKLAEQEARAAFLHKIEAVT